VQLWNLRYGDLMTNVPADVRIDAVLQLQLVGRLLADQTMRKLWDAGFDDLRESDGYVFQHLVPGPLPITELAARLGVTQQAASKSVADLEVRGYVERKAASDDARVRLVALSARGTRVIRSTRSIRAALEKKVLKATGDAARFARALDGVVQSLGGAEVLTNRRLVAPR
jgi:DNA-binding MarR family transcriptional regulator